MVSFIVEVYDFRLFFSFDTGYYVAQVVLELIM